MAIRTITHSRGSYISNTWRWCRASRLYPLTAARSKPAGAYRRQIQVSGYSHFKIALTPALEECFVLTPIQLGITQQAYLRTLIISVPSARAFVDILAAEQTPDNPTWYQGHCWCCSPGTTAILPHLTAIYILILSGDQFIPDGFCWNAR